MKGLSDFYLADSSCSENAISSAHQAVIESDETCASTSIRQDYSVIILVAKSQSLFCAFSRDKLIITCESDPMGCLGFDIKLDECSTNIDANYTSIPGTTFPSLAQLARSPNW